MIATTERAPLRLPAAGEPLYDELMAVLGRHAQLEAGQAVVACVQIACQLALTLGLEDQVALLLRGCAGELDAAAAAVRLQCGGLQ